jgi:effector-binding domain-containing protein
VRRELCNNPTIKRIYKEELKNRLLSNGDFETNGIKISLTRRSVCSKPPRHSYEKFVREEAPEEIVNSLADFVLGKSFPSPHMSTMKHKIDQSKLPGRILE